MASIMPFEKFEYIMSQIKDYEEKRDRISNFFDKEICSDSWCYFTVGEELQHALTCLLADEFNCWYQSTTSSSVDEIKESIGVESEDKKESEFPKWWDKSTKSWDNDIEYWLYEDSKRIIIDGKEIPIGTLQEFYNYLIKYCVDKKEN